MGQSSAFFYVQLNIIASAFPHNKLGWLCRLMEQFQSE